MKEAQNLNRIAKYLSDNIDAKEREELFAWIEENPTNKALFEDSLEIWEESEKSKEIFTPNTEIAWDKMANRLSEARSEGKKEALTRPLSFIRPWMKIAAAAILLLGVAWWLMDNRDTQEWVEERTFAQEKTTIELPDGSKVWLNQNSTLSYEKVFDKRVVKLEGEAFFEVAKRNGKPFEIFAGTSKTKVLGTSFNVRAYPKEQKVELAVETGKVAFSAKEVASKNVLLVAGDYATFTKKTKVIKKEEVTKLNAAAWKKKALRYKNAKMEEVIESLERYYNISIQVDNPKIFDCPWMNTITYEKPVLEDILGAIDYALDNAVLIQKKKNKVYLFSGAGCD